MKSKLVDTTVLVTGGAGYIGSHTVKMLLEQGYEVIVYDNLSEGYQKFILTEEKVIADLGNLKMLKQTFKENSINAVMHFAAHCKVGESVENPQKYYQNNVINSLKLLRVMIENEVDKLIFSSSAAIYGTPQTIPIPEEHVKNPESPYGRTKWIFEQILTDYVKAYDIGCISLRYFNAAGSDPQGEIGELHDPETHLIPIVLDVALGKRERIEVFGMDYPTPDGTCIRDFIHVNDLAKAHILALEKLDEIKRHKAYNLGIGRGYSVREVIDTCRRITGKEIRSVDADRRAGDPPELIADSSKANHELNWKPEFDNLSDIVETAWNWHKKRDSFVRKK